MEGRGDRTHHPGPLAMSAEDRVASAYCHVMATIKLKVKPGAVPQKAAPKSPPKISKANETTPYNERKLHRPQKGGKPIVMGRSTGGLINSLVCLGHDYTYRIRLDDNTLYVEKLTNAQTLDERVEVIDDATLSINPYTLKLTRKGQQ